MEVLTVKTVDRTAFIDITSQVQKAVTASGIRQGVCLVYVPHTTAAVTINENADPDVVRDILETLNTVIPFDGRYRHGEGNSAAHIKSTLVGASQAIPVADGRLALGTWQAVFFCEFDGPRSRRVFVQVVGS